MIKLNNYKIVLPFVYRMLKQNPTTDLRTLAGIIATTCHCELIVVAYYIQHIEGESKEIKELMDDLVAYYKYDKIDEVENFPPKGYKHD